MNRQQDKDTVNGINRWGKISAAKQTIVFDRI